MSQYLFVYGTLMQSIPLNACPAQWRQELAQVRRELNQCARFMGTASCLGELFDLGGYPGLVAGKGQGTSHNRENSFRVHGELYRIRNAKTLFNILDDFEGCTPAYPKPWQYRRQVIPIEIVETQANIQAETMKAWAYIYQGSTRLKPRIPSGRFSETCQS
ncbi:MAG: gamma-glutamylcyclotransferase family protein [Oceanobacter sp.]